MTCATSAVREPGRVIPRSILISLGVVALLYVLLNLSVIGVVPWQEFVPASDDNPVSSTWFQSSWNGFLGARWLQGFTLLILWTAVASVFALLLGYSRIPYAAARDGNFFKVFARLHPAGGFPHVSLVVIGGVSVLCCALSLEVVIEALVTTRILIQFIGQIIAVALLRRRAPAADRPYRIWLYPLPSLLALVGWSFVFITAGLKTILFSLGVIVAGVAFYLVWARAGRRWPFSPPPAPPAPAQPG